MAINKNHEFEELDGIKCAIVEKGVSEQRTQFLKDLLQTNGYTVVVVPTAPPKTAPAPAAIAEGNAPSAPTPPPPSLFTIGVTDVTFNAINAIFGRMLKTRGGRVVTLAYWQQKEDVPQDDIPYFERKL
jgi:hypothetical protein